MRTPVRRAAVAWLSAFLLLIAAIAVLHHRVCFGDVFGSADISLHSPFFTRPFQELAGYSNGIQGDVWRMGQPATYFMRELSRQHLEPGWNPHIFLGQSFGASVLTGQWHPLEGTLRFMDPMTGRTVLAIARLLLAGAGVLAWLGRNRVAPASAALAAVVYALSAYNIRWLQSDSMTQVSATLPWLLWSIDGVARRPSAATFAVMALVAGWLQLCGHPETQFVSGLTAGVYALFSIASVLREFGGRRTDASASWLAPFAGRIAVCLAAMVAGVLMAAVSLLPFAHALAGSADLELNLHGAASRFPLIALAELLLPDFWGRPRCGQSWDGPGNYNLHAIYFGSLAAVVAACAAPLCRLRTATSSAASGIQATVADCSGETFTSDELASLRKLAFFGALMLLVGWGAVLDGSPFALLLDRLPVLRLCKAAYFQLSGAIGAVALVGVGATMIGRPGAFAASRRWLTAILAFVVVVKGAWFFGRHGRFSGWAELAEDPWVMQRPFVQDGAGLLLTVGALVAVACCRGAAWRRRWLSAFVVAELIVVAWDFNQLGPRDLFDPPRPPLLDRLVVSAGPDRILFDGYMAFPNLCMRYGFRDLRGYDFPTPSLLQRAMNRVGFDGLPMKLTPEATRPAMNRELAALLSRAAVRYFVAEEPRPSLPVDQGARPFARRDEVDWRYRIDLSGRSVEVFENPRAMPRVYLPRSCDVAEPGAAFERLFDLSIDPHDHVLTTPVTPDPGSTAAGGGSISTPARGSASIVDDGFNQVRLAVDTPTGGLVVLADRWEQGWTVTVDGAPARPWIVDALFRGVVVPPGRHEVTWSYSCPWLATGKIISLAALTSTVAMLMIGWGRRMPPR